MEPFDVVHDPYRRCEDQCNHDLARGILVSDLLSGDGPHPPSHLIVNFNLQRVAIIANDEEDLAA